MHLGVRYPTRIKLLPLHRNWDIRVLFPVKEMVPMSLSNTFLVVKLARGYLKKNLHLKEAEKVMYSYKFSKLNALR